MMKQINTEFTEDAKRMIKEINEKGLYPRFHLTSSYSLGYLEVSSPDERLDYMLDIGVGKVLLDKASYDRFDGIEIRYAYNPGGWSYIKCDRAATSAY